MDQHLLRLKIDPSQFDDLSEYPKLTKETDADRMIRFLCTVGQLKTIDRTGWILKGREIKKPETIAGKCVFLLSNIFNRLAIHLLRSHVPNGYYWFTS